MKAIIVKKPGNIKLEDKAYPENLESNEVRLKVKTVNYDNVDGNIINGFKFENMEINSIPSFVASLILPYLCWVFLKNAFL